MKRTVLAVLCIFFASTLIACNISELFIPEKVTIEGTTYRNGFYGDLWSENLIYKGDSYKVGNNEFHRVECEKFDWVHSDIGSTTSGVLYCAESQWEQAYEYYHDSDNFTYYCRIGAQYEDRDPVLVTISDMDTTKFEELMSFADKNSYNPFGSNKGVETRRLPIPDRDEAPELIFYKVSKDGFFTSYQGDEFFVIDGKLLLLFYYDYGHGQYEELVAVEVPDEIGKYFIELVEQFNQ